LVFEDYISDVFKREMTAIYRSDLTLIISEFEMELATTTFNIDPKLLYYMPFLSENASLKTPKFSERNHFVIIGNFLHEPNWQTVILLKKYWPTIKKQLPNAQLHVYGSYVTEKAKQLHNEKEGFLIQGRAEEVASLFLNAKVLLAPIPYGAGLKGKLFEAMQFGLPSVTTLMGAEGMRGAFDWNGAVTTNETAFIEQAVRLYSDESLWEKAQENGFTILEHRFKKALFASDFKNKITQCLQNLVANRQTNFWGQILQHHSLQSTKYMSKWIEAKNK
jgi:glycosyltransferase involved in cell wall biosynthesis